MSSSTATIYRRAADRLEEVGWSQKAWRKSSGEECVVQALLTALDDGALSVPMSMDLPAHIARELRCHIEDHFGGRKRRFRKKSKGADDQKLIIMWNDQRGMRMSTVLRMLRSLADRLDPPSPFHPSTPPLVWHNKHHVNERELVLV